MPSFRTADENLPERGTIRARFANLSPQGANLAARFASQDRVPYLFLPVQFWDEGSKARFQRLKDDMGRTVTTVRGFTDRLVVSSRRSRRAG